eukprot:m.71112 g.71112  ORF g.71112 m.71112 type:complete len:113 (+) comp13802_c1_seq6:1956-2294(+)
MPRPCFPAKRLAITFPPVSRRASMSRKDAAIIMSNKASTDNLSNNCLSLCVNAIRARRYSCSTGTGSWLSLLSDSTGSSYIIIFTQVTRAEDATMEQNYIQVLAYIDAKTQG